MEEKCLFWSALIVCMVHVCRSADHCPGGNCTIDFASIFISCKNLQCDKVPLLDTDSRSHLKVLELQDNSISELPYMEYKDMDTLDLSSNRLRAIPNASLASCQMLDIVDLSYNEIDDIDGGAFNSEARITTIDASWNALTAIPRLEMFSLRELNLSHNAIVTVNAEAFLWGLSRLVSLDLSYNRIGRLHSEAFHGLYWLTNLHLQGNELVSLADNVFHTHLTGLSYLDLSFNGLETLSHNALTDLGYLEHLDLSNNRLHDVLDLHFLGLTVLRTLFLHNNDIRNLSQGLVGECDNLLVLDVSSNPVQEVHSNLFVHKLKRSVPLQVLRMNDLEGLTEIFNGTFWGLPDLLDVELSHNVRLKTIQPAAFDPVSQSIRILNLRYNKLDSISERLVNWGRLEKLDIGGNPWDCDCRLLWTKGEAFPAGFREELTCMYPTFLQGQTVDRISASKFSCSFLYEHRRGGAISLVVLLTIAFMAVGGVLLHKYRHRVFPCFYETPMYRSFYNPLYTDEKDHVKAEKMRNEPTAV